MATDVATPQNAGEAAAIFKAAVASEAGRYGSADSMLSARMPNSVKGKGYISGIRDQDTGKRKLAPTEDPEEILRDSMKAEDALRKAVKNGVADPTGVYKGLNPQFSNQLGSLMTQHPSMQGINTLVGEIQGALSEISGKNFTLTSPNATGFVPFDLVSPSRLLYPVYSPLRNKIPRTPGQGVARQEKVVTAISGSGQNAAPALRITQTELMGGSLSGNWPLSLPGSGTQISENIDVPYRYWGMTEALSWLSQFASQGFEDLSALANLILLQEFMLAEEYADLFATSHAPSAPVVVSATLRAKGAGETAITGSGTNVYVAVTATNAYGETTISNVVQAAGTYATGTQVADVVIAGVPSGTTAFNVYAAGAASAPAAAGLFLKARGVGGVKFTVQGALPTTGAAPASNTGTHAATDQEGLISVLSGNASDGSMYPTNWGAGYYNNAVGDTLNSNVLNAACGGLWSGTNAATGMQAFKADPSELIAEGSDIQRVSDDILAKGSNGAYRINIQQSEVGSVRDGAAVSEFQNPITRSVIKFMVHPWMSQGTALLMSYTLPMAWSNVSNVVEKVVVQDYLSISWPVIDASFRYSMFMYGALVFNAPQYCGLLQGLQTKDGNGSSTPWA